MDFRKFENNHYQLKAAQGNIVKFLKEIYLSFVEFAKDGNYKYHFTCDQDEILVYFDRYKLERVFYNLISNAFRYTPKGGKIDVQLQINENCVLIKVSDSGIGVSKEYQHKIFERFFEINLNNNHEKQYHKGIDLRAARRTPVHVTADGVIRYVEDKNKGTFGLKKISSVFKILLVLTLYN